MPYHLNIKYSQMYRGYKIEFSAKILGDSYPDLINANNIRECLNKVNALGIGSLDVDGILREAKVIGADFTKDIRFEDIPNINTMKELKSVIRLSIHNYNRWNCANYIGGGMVISNAVSDRRRRRRLTVYDKTEELRLATNRPFLDSLENSERLIDYFMGRVRFELRATTQFQLRKWLGLRDTKIMNVLTSTVNPLQLVMSEMFAPLNVVAESEIKRKPSTLDRLNTLKQFDWDLARVEAHVRENCKGSVRRVMEHYEMLYRVHRLSNPIYLAEVVGR